MKRRRYLSIEEAEASLRRGKSIEMFLGRFTLNQKSCIRWASFSFASSGITGMLWEAFDQGSEEYESSSA